MYTYSPLFLLLRTRQVVTSYTTKHSYELWKMELVSAVDNEINEIKELKNLSYNRRR